MVVWAVLRSTTRSISASEVAGRRESGASFGNQVGDAKVVTICESFEHGICDGFYSFSHISLTSVRDKERLTFRLHCGC